MSIRSQTDFRTILKNELSERLSSNPQYSLRAFARDLGFSSAQVSHVLSGRKGLSPSAAQKIGAKLGWTAEESEYFCQLVAAAHGRSAATRSAAQTRVKSLTRTQPDASPLELQLDAFHIISEWHHFPILELLKTPTPPTPRNLARRLGLREIEVQLALGRLERLELISRTSRGYRVNQETAISKDNVPSDAVRKFHLQIMEKARSALLQQAVNERYFRSVCFPIRRKSVPKIQDDIRQFFERLTRDHSADGNGEEIYALSTQFFRLTEKDT